MKRTACIINILVCLLVGNTLLAQQPVKPVRKAVIKIDKTSFDKLNVQYEQLQRDLKELEFQRAQINRLAKEYASRLEKVNINLKKLEGEYDKALDDDAEKSADELLQATKQLQEIQSSFSIQYLQLQQQMQQENRRYTTLSNIMKTKHDTAKNSISNIK